MADPILVVDDEPRILESVGRLLEREGWRPYLAKDGAAAEAILDREPGIEVAFLDVALPGDDGLTILRRWAESRPSLTVILMSGHGTIEMAVEATRLGAYDFLEKPLSSDKVLVTARNAAQKTRLERENESLRERAGLAHALVGRSKAIEALKEQIALAAPTTATVLLTGESGTGKELVARALHDLSPRRGKPFVALNAAALPEDLVESELFGHEKGAFTGAVAARRGKFEEANRGTLFLDEIGDMSAHAQAKLLRVLQDGLVTRLGGSNETKVDVRVVAATHRSLADAIAAGRFREDLFYRLNVLPLAVPPLRDRPEDAGLLAEHFLAHIAKQIGRRPKTIDRAAVTLLSKHRWPGNVRELRNLIERLVILTPGNAITAADVARHLPDVAATVVSLATPEPAPVTEAELDDEPAAAEGTLKARLDAAEKIAIEEALAAGGTVARAAELLGLERSHLYKKLRKHRLPY